MILIEEIQQHETELLYDLLKAIEELEELVASTLVLQTKM